MDTRIANDVRAALERDPRIRHPELIAVSADGIGTVALHGAVENVVQRLAAAHDAQQVNGVFEVILDDLKVHPPISNRRADDQIRVAAMQRLVDDSRLHADHIHVKVSHGQVTLTGYTRDTVQRAYAEQDVTSVTGVVGVANQITIR